ncbi:OmpH family outer membrane protein [Lentiprolixibacter aurantiacus]|uniref:OmpH family outer membrane protein n=1 Tax=Lentiprolixibacter aurantiacus TaxID=2993939 RepID=A0AAE3MJL5_9FLAO|nr:OmpH family outer membrane protein [Lentiprolixibacter aurantiacus]MCX2718521.1 OmpH family outer membrane protein [Lentiprolixibacter aurantiacus]
MKKLMLIISVILLTACQTDKIGFVDNSVLMENYQEKKDVESRYNMKSEAYAKKRDSITQSFQMEAQALQTKTKGMSEKKAQEEYALLQQKGQFIGQQLQQEEQQIQMMGQMEMDSLVSRVKREIDAFGKANGYSYILGKGEGGGVLYGNEDNDLTQDILKILNEKYQQ